MNNVLSALGMRWLVPLVVAAGSVTIAAESVSAEFREAGEIQRTVEQVLSDPEYRHLIRKEARPVNNSELPDWLKRFLEWLFGSGREATAAEPVLKLGPLLFYLATGVVIVLLVVLLVAAWRRTEASAAQELLESEGEEAITPSVPPGDKPANEYERRALAAAEQGDFRSALRELVLGSMSWTERAGLVRYRRGLSNRDYIRAVWRRLPQRESLQRIVLEFERVFYGRRPASSTTFEFCLAEFRKSFAREEADAHLAG